MMKKLFSLVLAFCFILAASVSSLAEIDLGTQITAEDYYSGLGGTYTEDADTLRVAMYHSGANNLIW